MRASIDTLKVCKTHSIKHRLFIFIGPDEKTGPVFVTKSSPPSEKWTGVLLVVLDHLFSPFCGV